MRGFGVMSAAVLALGIFVMTSAGCEEDKKDVCCKCTCYVLDNALPERIRYESGTNLNCNSACETRCVDIEGMLSRDPVSVDCGSVPTDN